MSKSKKEKKVWLVTSGEYSDYRLDSVWSTKRKAEKHAKMIKGNVDERILNKTDNVNGVGFYFTFDKNGNLAHEWVNEFVISDENISDPSLDETSKEIYVEVFSKDRDKAFKIACDKRANFLAQLNGI